MSFDKIICQSCGAEIPGSGQSCEKCGAPLPGKLKEAHQAQEKEKFLDTLDVPIANKIRDLDAKLAENPNSVALCIQLSNAYKDAGIKEFAVEYMERAASLDPDNKFLRQKVRMLIDPAAADESKIERIDAEMAATRSLFKYVVAGIGVILLIVAAIVVYRFVNPSVIQIAKGGKKTDAIAPIFSDDGSMVAYIEQPKFTIFGVVDSMAGVNMPKGDKSDEAWLMVKPIKGEPKQLVKIGSGAFNYLDFAWRPGHKELTYTSWSLDDFDLDADEHIYSVSASGGEPVKLASGTDFAWSKDGSKLAYARAYWSATKGSGLYVLHMDLGTEKPITDYSCQNPRWSPTEDKIVAKCRDTEYEQSLAKRIFFTGDGVAGDTDSYKKLARYQGDLYIYDHDNGSFEKVPVDGDFRSPSFTPDGTRIVALTHVDEESSYNDLVTMNLDGSDHQILLSPGAQYEWFGDYDFSPDGTKIAFEGYFPNPDAPEIKTVETPLGPVGGGKNYVSDVFIANIDGTGVKRLESSKHKYKARPVYSPDGKYLAYEVMYLDMRKDVWAAKMK